MKTSPDPATLPEFYKNYVSHVSDQNLIDVLRSSVLLTDSLIRSIPETKGEYRYAPGKWSIKELLCHMLDAERIFAYRALRFARKDQTELHGFDEQRYAPHANAHSRTLNRLADEFKRLRAATLDLFESFTPEMLACSGKANNHRISVINLGYVIAGHEVHHRNILAERYLK
ncbi:DinB family protein [Oscillatoria amoena NRMC-F 0135]|nr:DinB family protein [Oscillatoria amoena NRMC-F 0135]